MPTHSEQRVLPHSPEQLFDLVADVGRYPEFLPWCVAARIISRSETAMRAELAIGFKGMRERFVSRVTLDRPNLQIRVEYLDGPFSKLDNRWSFRAIGESACTVEFFISYEFRSRTLGLLMGAMFDQAFRRFADAFERRADVVYRRPPPQA